MGSDTESSSDDDFADFRPTSRQKRVAQKKKASKSNTSSDNQLQELQKMLAAKKKSEKKVEKISKEMREQQEEIGAEIKENAKAAKELMSGKSSQNANEGFISNGHIFCFSPEASSHPSQGKAFPLGGLHAPTGSTVWDQIRKDNLGGGQRSLLEQGVIARICHDQGERCPDDVAQWLFCLALGMNDPKTIQPATIIAELSSVRESAMVALAAVLFNEPALSPSLASNNELILALKRLQSPSGGKQQAACPTWRPSCKLFVQLLTWAGMTPVDKARSCEFSEDKRAWKSINEGKPQLPIGSLLSLLEIFLLAGHFDYGSQQDALELLLRLFLLRVDNLSLSASSMQSLSGQNALPEFIDSLPETMWRTSLVRELCSSLVSVAVNVDRKSLSSRLSPEMRKYESAADAAFLLLTFVERLPANHTRCNIIKRFVCLELFRKSEKSAGRFGAALPILSDSQQWPEIDPQDPTAGSDENDTDNPNKSTQSRPLQGGKAVLVALEAADKDSALSELGPGPQSALLVEAVIAAMMPQVIVFVKLKAMQTGGMRAYDFRCLVLMLKVANIILHDAPKLGPKTPDRSTLVVIRNRFYSGLDKFIFLLPRNSSHTSLLVYISQLATAMKAKHGRMQKKRSSISTMNDPMGGRQTSLQGFVSKRPKSDP